MLETKLETFKGVVEELATLYEEKNREYGDSFGKMFDEDGVMPGLYQIKHKLNRAITIAHMDDVKFESLEDTLKDMANYAIMTYVEVKRRSEPQNFTKFI